MRGHRASAWEGLEQDIARPSPATAAAGRGLLSLPFETHRPLGRDTGYNGPMPRYQRYLLRQLLGPFVLVATGLTAVVWLSQSLRIIDLIVNKGLSLSAFMLMSMLVLPTFLGAVLPIAFFCSLLFVYNRLTIDSELVSLRAAGVGQWSLAKPPC